MVELLVGIMGEWLIWLAGGAIALALAWWKGRSAGIRRERDKQIRDRLEARETRADIDDEVARQDSDATREELRRWSR